jgi:hypothetical protein
MTALSGIATAAVVDKETCRNVQLTVGVDVESLLLHHATPSISVLVEYREIVSLAASMFTLMERGSRSSIQAHLLHPGAF